jgi:hypothetical protein
LVNLNPFALDKVALDAFLEAYNAIIFKPGQKMSDLLIPDGNMANWKKLEWREVKY